MVNHNRNHNSGGNSDDLPTDGGPDPEKNSKDNKYGEARRWLRMIDSYEDAFNDWNQVCDGIEEQYANLSKLSQIVRDREFQMFWANTEVLKPSIYAKPPKMVVTSRYKDRRPLYQQSSELLERSSNTAMELTDIDTAMRMVRDDLTIIGRGALWLRYESGRKSNYGKRVVIEHKHRKDFAHSPVRNWSECTWVAAASHLTREKAKERFKEHSGDEYLNLNYRRMKDAAEVGASDNQLYAKVWEIWHKDEDKVVWVGEGCQKLLDESEPHLELEGGWPAPKPAYATLQRGSLVPVPDQLFYRDQLYEINELTTRIHALCNSLRVKGFYPRGAGEISDAIEIAMRNSSNDRILVPITNWAAFGSGSAKDTIVWLPIDVIAETLRALVDMRKQVIDDVYQIMGLSDIMRGSTSPEETLGAQQLKVQSGSVRIRDKKEEIIRVARDAGRIMCEIMSENFDIDTLIDMSSMEIITEAENKKQIRELEGKKLQITQQLQQMKQSPQLQQMVQQDPQKAKGMMEQVTKGMGKIDEELAKMKEKPTQEKIEDFLRDNRMRPFALDVETDSTVQPDEDQEKKLRSEFLIALGNILPQIGAMVEKEPATADFAGELLKFVVAPYRSARTLDPALDQLVEAMKQKGQAGPQTPPEVQKIQAQTQSEEKRLQFEQKKHEDDTKLKQMKIMEESKAEQMRLQSEGQVAAIEAQGKVEELKLSLQELDMKMKMMQQKAVTDQRKAESDERKTQVEMMATEHKASLDMQKHEQDLAHNERKQTLAEQTAQQNAALTQAKTHATNSKANGGLLISGIE